ncbi:MAG: hypothetical protein JW863_11930 [Chitinispirillaceae bacterium]|nr:hypothetical protein [Chitinispirillaceae bacterium]
MKTTSLISSLSLIVAIGFCFAQDSTTTGKVLFVSDKTDKPAKFFLDAFTEELTASGRPFDEVAVDAKSPVDPAEYSSIVVYSQVMAFNNISPVSAWVKSQKSLQGKRLFLFVTANRWFYESRLKKLVKLVGDRDGEVVDAVTMATTKMNAEQKRGLVRKMVKKMP